MPTTDTDLFWIGDVPCTDVEIPPPNNIDSLSNLPVTMGGAICFSYRDKARLDQALRAFHSHRFSWSWCVFVSQESEYSTHLSDGVFEPDTARRLVERVREKLTTMAEPEKVEPLIGWLGVNRQRRVSCRKDLSFSSIYRYPIIESLYPELESTYRFVLAEQKHHVLEAEMLVDRIRVCSSCHSGHLNYVDVCPHCVSIDIESISSLHCFTCGHVGEQQSFLRRGRLECPKCLTQLRHIGVDYDRPLENHQCNHCAEQFAEASTVAQCMSCEKKSPVDELVVRKMHRFKLGEMGEYVFQHGKQIQAPELSFKGKVNGHYFQNLISWVNKVALRHQQAHLLMALYFPSIDEYGRQHGDSKLFALIDQITARLGGLFRDTDLCCQYKQDVLLVLMPKTSHEGVSAIESKLSELSRLIEVDDFELDIYTKNLPDVSLGNDAESWLENWLREIYVER